MTGRGPSLFPCVRPLYAEPLLIDRALDCEVFDRSGRRWLDAYAGVASVSVGHSHPRVVAAIREQAGRVGHTTMLYRTQPLLDYLAALQTELPPAIDHHFFVNSGSEALDFACQVARTHRRRETLVAFSEGFHGGSSLAKSITGLPAWQPAIGGDRNVHFHPLPPCRTCPHRGVAGASCGCGGRCLDELEVWLTTRGRDTAAIVIEPVLGVGGIIAPPADFFCRLRRFADQFELDLIVDEVQSGFGRCGRRLFEFDALGFEPDLVCMGKGIANGMAMGLVSARASVAMAMAGRLHFSTFGGNPLACAAALATLRVIRDQSLIDRAGRVGNLLTRGLHEAIGAHPRVVEIRGPGLMLGVEFDDPLVAQAVLDGCHHRGVLVGIGGRHRNVIRVEPPLTFSEAHAAETVAAIAATLAETPSGRPAGNPSNRE